VGTVVVHFTKEGGGSWTSKTSNTRRFFEPMNKRRKGVLVKERKASRPFIGVSRNGFPALAFATARTELE